MENTIKSNIEKFVLAKINNEEWKIGETIPSESSLADILNCSRTTIRNALQTFVSLGMLKSIQGVGYEVTKTNQGNFSSISKIYNAKETRVTPITIEEYIKKIKKWLLKNVDSIFHNHQNEDELIILKKQFLKNKELKVAQVSIINKGVVWGVTKERIYNSLTSVLSDNKVEIESINKKLFFKDFEILKDDFVKLGYTKESALIEVSETLGKNEWIEICIRIIHKDLVNIESSTKIVATN